MLALRRLSAFFFTGLMLWGVLCAPVGEARTSGMASLRLIGEVRDVIHREYVDEVDSMQVIYGAIDGMVGALPAGENLFISPPEMAAVEGLKRQVVLPRLDDRGQLALLTQVLNQVRREYIEPVALDTLSAGAVWGMLATLDPHSNYLSAAAYEEMVEQFRGDFEGIGIYFDVHEGRLMVIAPIAGSPSEGKLRAGDRIVEIEGVSTEGITSEEVMKKLRGRPGSTVRLSVERKGVEDWLEFTIERARIDVRSVPYAFVLRPGIGYIHINRFAEKTGEELGRALGRLRAEGAKHLLLDLRQNGGGLLAQAVEVADYFVERGELIVYTQGRTPASRQEYRARHRRLGAALGLVVMIDHGSASASEIVAGAIQDLDLGLIAGQTSFGKGLVQQQFPLKSNGGWLLLTVARYYTPLGRLIQRPYSGDLRAYIQEGLDDVDPNAVDSLRARKEVFYTASGRAVYGGGGITPDVVLEEEPREEFVEKVVASGALFDFGSYWVGQRRDWPADFARFLQHYQPGPEELTRFRAFAAERGLRFDEASFAAHRAFVARELKAEIARVLWGVEERYRVHIEGDTQVRQALELFDRADALLAAHLGR